MLVLGYGEDALTLWAINHRLQTILEELHDSCDPSECQAFFSPSFGRGGREGNPRFGEFDFIILSESCLYLGESKWDGFSGKVYKSALKLLENQTLRHECFRQYVNQWLGADSPTWQEFAGQAKIELSGGISKPLPPAGSRLARNLETVLDRIKEHFLLSGGGKPAMVDVLLYFLKGQAPAGSPRRTSDGFELVYVDYSEDSVGNFVKINI